MAKHRIYRTSFGSVYPHYVAKAEKKGRTKSEVDAMIKGVICGVRLEDIEEPVMREIR